MQSSVQMMLDAGYVCIPLCATTPHSHGGKGCKFPGKVPLARNWETTPAGRYGAADFVSARSYGVLLGDTDLVLDIDPRNFPEKRNPVHELVAAIGVKPRGFMVKTGGGGYHIYMKKPAGLKLAHTLREFPGLEFKTKGRQVVGPGSLHVSGAYYTVISGTPSDAVPAPDTLLALLRKPEIQTAAPTTGGFVDDATARRMFADVLAEAAPAIQGQNGDEATFKLACRARDYGLSVGTTLDLMAGWNARCVPPWTADELRAKVENAYRYASGPVGAKHPAAVFPAPEAEKTPLAWNLSSSNKVLKTFHNLLNYLRSPDHGLDGIFSYNEFTGRVVFVAPAPWHKGRMPLTRTVSDNDLKLLKGHLSSVCGFDAGLADIEAAVTNVAYHHRTHPVRDYLSALVWDGKPRLDTWLRDYMGVGDSLYSRACASKTLCAAVWRVFQPGVKFDHVLVLEGAQDLGKSSAVAILGGAWATDSPVDPHSRDTVDLLQGRWIVEMAEMEVARRVDEEALKAFITRRVDMARLAYGRTTQEFPRQCIFIATKNPRADGTYLNDEENRRWWPVRCAPEVNKHGLRQIDFEGLAAARDQLFAEAVVRYKAMKHFKELSMDTPELKRDARAESDRRRTQHEWTDGVAVWLARRDRHPDTRQNFYTARAIFIEALGGADRMFDRKAQRAIATVMRTLGWDAAVQWDHELGRAVRGYQRMADLAYEPTMEGL